MGKIRALLVPPKPICIVSFVFCRQRQMFCYTKCTVGKKFIHNICKDLSYRFKEAVSRDYLFFKNSTSLPEKLPEIFSNSISNSRWCSTTNCNKFQLLYVWRGATILSLIKPSFLLRRTLTRCVRPLFFSSDNSPGTLVNPFWKWPMIREDIRRWNRRFWRQRLPDMQHSAESTPVREYPSDFKSGFENILDFTQ
jgi:hypothetical protein